MAARNRIRIDHARYYARDWLVESEYDGTWVYAAVDGTLEEGKGTTFVFLRILDMVEYCGRDTEIRWEADVSVVDTVNSAGSIRAALDCVGSDLPERLKDLPKHQMIAETLRPDVQWEMAYALFTYGARSPMWDGRAGELPGGFDPCDLPETDRAWSKLRVEALKEAKKVLEDEVYRNELLDTRVVNKLGQTAREYAQADGLWKSLRRISGDPEASVEQQLVLKMYQNSERTLGGEPIPADIKESE